MIVYITEEECRDIVFPYIHRVLTKAESAADYEHESDGMAELRKVLSLVQLDYYPSFFDKAAYIVCSIAGSQYFSNGNKRLSIVTLLLFLGANGVSVKVNSSEGFRANLLEKFPAALWEDEKEIDDPHANFLYNLAILIGDRTRWSSQDFSVIREKVSGMFTELYEM